MVAQIRVHKIELIQNRIRLNFDCSEGLDKYFKEKIFCSHYNLNVSDIPLSIAVIPFVCNVLPLVWLTDSTLVLENLDEDFYYCLDKIKEGYKLMYPHREFNGLVKVSNLVKNKIESEKSCGAFFSGGVDAVATLIAHVEEKPSLITVRGADVKLQDELGWKTVVKNTEEISHQFGLDSFFIESNFVSFLNHLELRNLIAEIPDSWWHGIQHGIGLIGLAAPLAFIGQWSSLYIASTFTPEDKGKVTCASDPDIDGKVKFCGCQVYHDNYELSRLEKVRLICKYAKDNNQKIPLRVCYSISGGINCCECEKCIRTIAEIYAVGANPEHFGFRLKKSRIRYYRLTVVSQVHKITYPLWKEIQIELSRHPEIRLPKKLNWIREIDFFNEKKKKSFKLKFLFLRIRNKYLRFLKK